MPGLDGLRAIAVVGVIFSHLVQMRVVPSTHIWRMIGYRGAFGVQIFFVLSGFLITWLLLKEESKSGRVNFSRFYIRRSVRILPPAFVFLGCMIVLGLLGAFPVSIQEMLASVFFYRNYTNGGISTGHFWSLSVEEQFYLFWPILLVVIRKSWRIPLTTIVLLAAPLSRIIYLTFFDDIDDSLLTQFEYCYDMLLAGCLLSLLRHDARWKHRMRSGFLQSWKGLLIAFVFLGVGVGPMVPDHLAGILQLAGSLGVALLINFVVEGHRTPLDWLLNVSPMIWIGRLSYSLYLWQQLTCFVRPAGWWLNGFPQCVLFCIAAAMASYFLIEQPSLKLRDRLMRPKPKPAMA